MLLNSFRGDPPESSTCIWGIRALQISDRTIRKAGPTKEEISLLTSHLARRLEGGGAGAPAARGNKKGNDCCFIRRGPRQQRSWKTYLNSVTVFHDDSQRAYSPAIDAQSSLIAHDRSNFVHDDSR